MLKNILIRGIPEDIHRGFKRSCVNLGVSMQGRLIRLMEYEWHCDRQENPDEPNKVRKVK